MRRYLLLTMLTVWSSLVIGQITIYAEDMGVPLSNTSVNTYTGWQNSSPIAYSSTSSTTPDVRTSAASSGYTGVSGGGNVFFGTSGGDEKNMTIAGINTSNYNNIVLSFGYLRSNTTNNLTIEVSSDNIIYTPLTFTPNSSSNTWQLITASGTIPSTSNLRIRFSKNNTTQFRIDDIILTGDIASSGTFLNVDPTSLTVNEAAGTASISVSITNPSPTSATTADIALTSGDPSDVENYTTQTITFPANSSTPQTITVNITDDSMTEGYEELVFTLQNILGGTNAQSGNNTFTLGIEDNDLPTALDIRINELDSKQSGNDQEFIELYSPNGGNYSLDGLVLVLFNGNGDVSYNAWDLDGYVTDANGFFIIGSSTLPAGINPEINIPANTIQNGADAVALYYADAADFPNNTPVTSRDLIDALVYDTGSADDAGLLTGLNQIEQINENENSLSDTESIQRGSWFVAGPTPRLQNSLPIKLLSLTGRVIDNQHCFLEWTTAQEINNDYFTILHSQDGVKYEPLGHVTGAGNSIDELTYTFEHNNAPYGINYYLLKQTDYDGKNESFGPIEVEIASSDFKIYPYMSEGTLYVSTKYMNTSYQIFSIQGQLVKSGTLSGSIDISALPTGMYILHSHNQNVRFVRL